MLAEGIFCNLYGVVELGGGIFLRIWISFWVMKEYRFVKRCGTEPIWGISSNIILQIIFSEQTLVEILG